MRWLVASTVTYAVGLLYPAYATFKAVQQAEGSKGVTGNAVATSPDSSISGVGSEQDVRPLMTHWLMYWTVMSVFTVLETVAETFLFTNYWFPFYHEMKVFFILWLTLPQFRGATVIYKKLVVPHLSPYESQIDEQLHTVRKRVSSEMNGRFWQGVNYAKKNSVNLLAMGRQFVSDSIENISTENSDNVEQQPDGSQSGRQQNRS